MTTFTYRLLLNQTGRFTEYFGHHILIAAHTGTVEADTPGGALENLFHTFNMAHPEGYRNRSLSVGDVVELIEPGHADGFHYACQPVGWERIGHHSGVIAFDACGTCGGSGRQKIVAKTYTGSGWREEKPVFINCIACGAKGYQTAEEQAREQRMRDAWCSCGAKGGTTWHDWQPGQKEHATCNDCGKLTQVG